MYWCSLIMHPHPFDIISCIVTGIYLSNYNKFSIIIGQTSYLKWYQWYFIHREVLVRIDNMLLNNKCEMHWPSRTKISFWCMRMSYADRFQTFWPLTKCRPDLGPNNHLQLLKYLINPVEICRIKSYIIKNTLNVAALYFEDSGLVFDQRWKVSGQYLHLLKIENCRL